MSRPADDAPSGLTTTSYAVLAQLAVRPLSTYELAQQRVRYLRYAWPRAESTIYSKHLQVVGRVELPLRRPGSAA